MPERDRDEAQQILAHQWLARFGPATMDDLQWWTGWGKTTAYRAVRNLRIAEVDLDGATGIVLDCEHGGEGWDGGRDAEPVATLLPALDPTPMGWKQRDWFMGIDRRQIFDRAGNIGPTVWWNGEIVGSWGVAGSGEVRTTVVADRGTEARRAVEDVAARFQKRLEGTVVTPAIRTPLERSLV
jgi:hypothetical protein